MQELTINSAVGAKVEAGNSRVRHLWGVQKRLDLWPFPTPILHDLLNWEMRRLISNLLSIEKKRNPLTRRTSNKVVLCGGDLWQEDEIIVVLFRMTHKFFLVHGPYFAKRKYCQRRNYLWHTMLWLVLWKVVFGSYHKLSKEETRGLRAQKVALT